MSIFWIELIAAMAYIVLGPVMWGLFGFAMIKGRKRMRLLSRPVASMPQPPPTVTILVPAKDEFERIEACMDSILRLDYPHFDVIAIDDRSIDGTGEILDRIAASEPRLRIVHIKPGELPDGWGGKSYALFRGVSQARSEWLLFVDADVQLEPDVLSATVAVASARAFDMISLLPRFIGRTFWERLLQPLAGAATSAMFLIALTNSNYARTAFANGQFLLIRRDVYEKTGGHEAIRGTLSEDTAIARKLKLAGYRPRISWADEFASVRMYDSFKSIFRGWGRNFFVGSRGRPWRILAAGAFLLLCCFSAYAAIAWGFYRNANPLIAWGGWGWIVVGLLHWSMMTALLALIYVWSSTRWWYALVFPLGGSILLAIFARSLTICATGRVEWRGTSYSHAGLHAPQSS